MGKSRTEIVTDWRRRTKSRIIDSMGGHCQICGYNKCNEALELHHIKPEEKELSFGRVMSNPKSWDKIVVELRKCILICSCCHKEVHYGVTDIPTTYSKFDESYLDYAKKDLSKCPVCGKDKPEIRKTCSYMCSGSLSRKTDWGDVDLLELKKIKSNTEIAYIFGVTETAIWKRLKK